MAYQTVAEREAQFEAEMALNYPEQQTGFKGGFISGHDSVGSWLTKENGTYKETVYNSVRMS
jgi:hypothetical protein